MDIIFRQTATSGRVLGVQASYTPKIVPGTNTRMESFRSEGNINRTTPTVTVKARRGVIIASGGHSSNVNFRRIFDPRLTEEHQIAGAPYSFQDASGELAAMSIGASLWGTANSFERRRVVMKRNVVGSKYTYTTWGPKSPLFPFSRATGLNLGNAGWGHVISVNQVGKRFWNETQGELPDGTGHKSIDPYVVGGPQNTKIKYDAPQYLHAALAMNEGSVAPDYAAGPVWVIFDSAAVTRQKWNVTPPVVDIAGGYFFVADTLEELARKLTKNEYQKVPMPPEHLVATVARYNSFVDLGKDEDFEKPTPMYKIQTPPFYAAWGAPLCHDAVSGIRINGKCQVIDVRGQVIPNLYCGEGHTPREVVIRTHQAHVELRQPVPLEVEVGADIALKVKVTCPSGCDLGGEPVKVMTPDGVVMASEQLSRGAAQNNETEEFALRAPKQGGEYTWSVVFPRHETENIIHDESSLPMSLRTIPHKTSLAIWDVPSPVAMNSWFRAKIGIRCSARCQLAGQFVEVRDETGTKMGEGKLGETPWEGTDALYWGTAEIAAPATDRVCFWTVKFTGAALELAHDEASVNFSFRADKPPEHRVTIKVIGEDTRAPIRHAEVRLGFYITETDEGGLAKFELPEGTHHLKIWKDGYEGPPMSVEVSEDVTIQVEALKTLTEAEIEEKVRQFEASSWG